MADPFASSLSSDMFDLDRVELSRLAGGGAEGLNLPAFASTRQRFGQNALRDPQFLRSYFKAPVSAMEDPGYLEYARANALGRGQQLQGRQHWWDDPRQVAERGYQSLLNDRAAQSAYFLRTYGFDPLTNQTREDYTTNPEFLSAAARYGGRQAEAFRAAQLLGPQYGSAFTLTGQPGEGGIPFGYRRYTDELGNTFLVDGRGNIIR